MRFVGGDVQALFVDQVRGLDPEQCLLVPVEWGSPRRWLWWLTCSVRLLSTRSVSI